MSAAFDVINHQILFHRLENSFGITSCSLDWIRSYLNNRVQCVNINGVKSEGKSSKCGVPQGSVLGPMVYCMYTRPIGELLRQHKIEFHCYADDTQLYITFHRSDNLDSIKAKLEGCLEDLRNWMINNKLKLNDDKTELIIFSSRS